MSEGCPGSTSNSFKTGIWTLLRGSPRDSERVKEGGTEPPSNSCKTAGQDGHDPDAGNHKRVGHRSQGHPTGCCDRMCGEDSVSNDGVGPNVESHDETGNDTTSPDFKGHDVACGVSIL